MKEHPLIFNTEMIKAILAGTKTMTRRVITSRNKYDWQVGDRIWVREKWRTGQALDGYPPRLSGPKSPFQYAADMATIRRRDVTKYSPWGKWRSSIHMPHWVSRILLEIIAIRKERLCDIDPWDCLKEGVKGSLDELNSADLAICLSATKPIIDDFIILWDSINNVRGYGWDTNPDVRVISFKLIEVKHANQKKY